MTGPLQHAPGGKFVHLNFNFHTMWRVTNTLSGADSAADYIEKAILRPKGIEDIYLYIQKPLTEEQKARTVLNYRGGGPTVATSLALLKFMQHYDLGGRPRSRPGNGKAFLFGSMPTSTAAMCQIDEKKRNFAIIVNSRSGSVTHARLNDTIRRLYNILTGKDKDPGKPARHPEHFGHWVLAPGNSHWIQETR